MSENLRRLLIAAVIVTGPSACVTVHRDVRLSPETAKTRVMPGDNVIVALDNGKRYKARIVKVTDTELVSEKARYAWEDIRYVAGEAYDAAGTAVASTGAWVLVGLAGAALMMEALEDADWSKLFTDD